MLTSSTQSFGAEDGMRTPVDRADARNFPQIPGLYRKSHASGHGRLHMQTPVDRCSNPPGGDSKLFQVRKVSAALLHFAPTVEALRIGDQRAISACTKALNFAGVRSALAGSDPPRSASRFWTSGLSSALSIAEASLSTIGFGVPLGAKIPAQMLIS